MAFPVVTVMTFPKVALGVWEDGNLLQWKCLGHADTTLELLLPQCFSEIRFSGIKGVATIKGAGPFTAVRSGCAWAQGLATGWGASLYMTSFFDLFYNKEKVWLDVGAGKVCTYLEQSFEYDPTLQSQEMIYVGPDFSCQESTELSKILYEKAFFHFHGENVTP
jgi:tRNA A37 threonylcarbamoyladenosine modification protein TsaB